ncbi:nitroreductase/quinone reductase family protein [Nocardia sp. NPDC050406]|uniref:nitroreductase/quinone reductase family protein n=1 Tax=Nocardia sp. NPDC050406 TaxID=3364318 RepID=UPI0037BC2A7E
MRKVRSTPGMRLINRLISARARRSTTSLLGMNILILHTTGRRTGQPRQSPVAWFPDGDHQWLIAASAAGAAANPDWYHNLKAHPTQIAIELDNHGPLPVTATELTGTDREHAWQQIVTAAPRFANYQRKSTRTIPVLRLTLQRCARGESSLK